MNETQLLAAVLEEYRSLRAQVVNTVDRQYSLAYWAISGVAIMIGGVANGWEKLRSSPTVLAVLVLFIVPAVITSYTILWAHMLATISKLGRYLYGVEETMARLVTPESIRHVYQLSESDDIEQFRLPIAWEHRLWAGSGGTHSLLARTARTVQLAVTSVHVICVAVGAMVIGRFLQLGTVATLAHPLVLAAIGFWFCVAVALTRYIRISIREGIT